MFTPYLILLLASTTFCVKTPPEEDFYYAAVVEYSPLNGHDGNDTLMKNVEEYISLISTASQNADIIVFPEEGLFIFDSSYTNYIEIPFGNNSIAPADDEHAHPALRKLSRAARDHKVYVTVNLREEDHSGKSTLHYNTNVIFDRDGKVIGRYRKFHLFGEFQLNITEKAEHMYFDSDFGVRFGTFTCFDILYKDPALDLVENYNVTDIIYPTWWFSSLPFFTATQTQAGWAFATDINLLAAGGNHVLKATTGSGIYLGKKGPVVYLQSQRDETCILFAKVFKKGKHGSSSGSISTPTHQGPIKKLSLWDDQILTKIDSVIITPHINLSQYHFDDSHHSSEEKNIIFNRTLCYSEFCCEFNVNMTILYKLRDKASDMTGDLTHSYHYRAAVFDGITKYYVTDAGVQLCAIISCLNDSLVSCGKSLEPGSSLSIHDSNFTQQYYINSTIFHNVLIKTSLLEKGSFSIPSLLELSDNPSSFGSLMNTSQFSFNVQNSKAELIFNSDKLITGGIYTRVFSRDPSPSLGFSNTCFTSFYVLILSVCLSFLFLYK